MRHLSTARLGAATFCALTLLAAPAAFAGKLPTKTKMDTPALSCAGATSSSIQLTVTAGATGAPAGFSVQWMTLAEYNATGWPVDSDYPPAGSSFCKASFSGNANGSSYVLAAGQSVTVQIGDTLFDEPGASSTCPSTPLLCGTEYVFRAFAHATSTLYRSDYSANKTCATNACVTSGGCTYTQGYWKTHGPIPTGNNTNTWPVTNLFLGTVNYTDEQVLSILNASGAGNGLVKLAHQLIAAKLNVKNGADDTAIADTIVAADSLIGGLVVPPVGSDSLASSVTSAFVGALTSYNEGTTGPGHCQDEAPSAE